MTRAIAIALLKGGIGKTTTAVNLGAGLANLGKQVLIIDCDVQGQIIENLGVSHPLGLAEFVLGKAAMDEALIEARPQLYIMPGGNKLVGLSRDISRSDVRGEEVIRKALAPLNDYFDYIILDTAPGYSPLLINVLFYATEVLCPVTLETMSLRGLQDFAQRLQGIRQYHPIRLSYVLPTMLDRRYAQSAELLAELENNFQPVLCEPIRTDIRLSEAPAFGQTIFEFAPKGRGADDYRRLAERVLADE